MTNFETPLICSADADDFFVHVRGARVALLASFFVRIYILSTLIALGEKIFHRNVRAHSLARIPPARPCTADCHRVAAGVPGCHAGTVPGRRFEVPRHSHTRVRAPAPPPPRPHPKHGLRDHRPPRARRQGVRPRRQGRPQALGRRQGGRHHRARADLQGYVPPRKTKRTTFFLAPSIDRGCGETERSTNRTRAGNE